MVSSRKFSVADKSKSFYLILINSVVVNHSPVTTGWPQARMLFLRQTLSPNIDSYKNKDQCLTIKMMKSLYSEGTELAIRYLSAISVGLIFELITGRFISHLGMFGTTMFTTMAIVMILAIPIWQLSAKLLSSKISLLAAELYTAVIIAILLVQPIYLPLFISNVFLPTVTETTKLEMLTWYVVTTSSVTMATLTTFLFIVIKNVNKLIG
jgi:hypothetical protein